MTLVAPSTIGLLSSGNATPEDVARSVVNSIRGYARVMTPALPEALEEYGLVYVATLWDKRKRGGRLVNQEKEILITSADWRQAVWRVEGTNTGNLLLLCAVHRTCRRHEGKAWEAAKLRVEAFVATEYQARPPPRLECIAERYAVHYALDMVSLPLWARLELDPPKGEAPKKQPQFVAYETAEEEETE